jgi:hypothetical protein
MKNETVNQNEEEEVPSSLDTKIPRFLLFTYIVLPIFGIYWFYSYWDGSHGVLDRGYWHELQVKANTTIYEKNQPIDENELDWQLK